LKLIKCLGGGDIKMIEIFKSTLDSQFHFRVVAKNNEIVAQSEGYTTKESCKKGIKAMKGSVKGRVKDLTK